VGTIPAGEAKPQFEAAIKPSRDGVEAAKAFAMNYVPQDKAIDSSSVIRAWWVAAKAPPISELILNDDYDYPDQVSRAARHWMAKLSVARAIVELVRDDYLEPADESLTTLDVQQAFTTVVERSGGSSGGWHLDTLSVRLPHRVRRGPFSRPWTPPTGSPQTRTHSPLEQGTFVSQALRQPGWYPLERRPIGEAHDVAWHEKLPAGLPQIVATAAARQQAVEALRLVSEALSEAAPTASPLERRIAEYTRGTLDLLVDLLSLSDSGGWAATDAQGLPMAQHLVARIVDLTRLVEGIVGWAEAAELLKRGLRAIGLEMT
jgi:hypothetical protein